MVANGHAGKGVFYGPRVYAPRDRSIYRQETGTEAFPTVGIFSNPSCDGEGMGTADMYSEIKRHAAMPLQPSELHGETYDLKLPT